MTLLDTHHHLDFLTDPRLRRDFLAELAARDVRVVAQTLTPSAFVDLVDGSDPSPDDHAPLWSLGLHPWQVSDDAWADHELAAFADAVRRTRFVGEVGLDLTPRRVEAAPAELQRRAFRRVLEQVCAAADDSEAAYVVSIHAVRAAGEVLDLLDELEAVRRGVAPVFHRFSGTSDELTRVVRLGGLVSVHPQLLGTKRGRAYVRQVPVDRLLLESDLPTEPVGDGAATAGAYADGLAALLRETVATLTDLRGDDVAAGILRTQTRLYAV